MAMPFKRRTFRRPFRRRFRPFAGRVRPKYDRVSLYNNMHDLINPPVYNCGPSNIVGCSAELTETGFPCHTDPGSLHCCSNTATFALMTNESLQTLFQDNITIVRLFGDIYTRVKLNFPTGDSKCDPLHPLSSPGTYASNYAEQWHLGLHKAYRSQELNPTVDTDSANPLYNYDWTEARWLWQRNKFWCPVLKRERVDRFRGSIIGVCNDVSGGSLLNPLDLGTGNIDTSVSTECCTQVCVAPNEGCAPEYYVQSANEPPWHHFRFSVKRHIRVKADTDLNLQVGLRHPAINNVSGWACDPATAAARAYNIQYYVKIGAVIRLN